jgi:hypothetical protein
VGWAFAHNGPIRILFWVFNRPIRMAPVSDLFDFIFLWILDGYVLTEYLVRIYTGYWIRIHGLTAVSMFCSM